MPSSTFTFATMCAHLSTHSSVCSHAQLIVAAAAERYNDAAGAVMRATLKAAEAKQVNVTEVRSGKPLLPVSSLPSTYGGLAHIDAVTTNNIVTCVPDDNDLASGLVYSSSKKQSTSTLVKEFIGILSAADNPTPAGVAGSFLSTSSTAGKVQVEFEIIHRRLRRRVLEAVVRERFGDDGVRMIRIMLNTGKMDDKHVSAACSTSEAHA